MKLLGILLFPFSSFLFSITKPFLSSPEYWFLSIIFTLVTLCVLFSCVFDPNWGSLSSLFRSALDYQVVQSVSAICVKIEILVTIERFFSPSFALQVLRFCFLVVHFSLLFLCMYWAYFGFATFSYTLFTIGFIYYRVRISCFNADVLCLPFNQTITLGQAFSFLDKALALNSSHAKLISVSSRTTPLCNKLSNRTNDLIVPFLI